MNELLDAVGTALDAVRRLGARPLESLNPGELMALNAAFGVLKRRTDAAYLPVAAEITRQSRPELGKDSLAKKQGYRTPATLISATTGPVRGRQPGSWRSGKPPPRG
jgi:5-methylcytosine-specific restriction protein A